MHRLSKAGTLGILIGVVGLLVSLIPFGFNLEEQVGLDILFTLRGTRQAPSDVVIVSIEKDSAVRLNLPADPRKWSRELHARLTENLTQAGAAVIAFDIIFDEARTAAEDHTFAEAIRQAGNVVLFEYLRKEAVSMVDQRGAPSGTVHLESLSLQGQSPCRRRGRSPRRGSPSVRGR
jgi:adenylate cyclase